MNENRTQVKENKQEINITIETLVEHKLKPIPADVIAPESIQCCELLHLLNLIFSTLLSLLIGLLLNSKTSLAIYGLFAENKKTLKALSYILDLKSTIEFMKFEITFYGNCFERFGLRKSFLLK